MKKMLAKAVVLGLVLGGIGFVANDAQAAKIGDGVKVFSGVSIGRGYDVKTKTALEEDTALANQKDLKAVNDDVIKNAKDIAAEAKAREDADTKLDAAIKDEATARKDADDKLGVAIKDEAKVRDEADKRIEAKFDGEVSRLDSKIDKLDARVEKVGAMAAAIANLHTMGYDPEAPTEIAVGVGQYRDKTGMALGAFHYPNRDFMLSFSVSTPATNTWAASVQPGNSAAKLRKNCVKLKLKKLQKQNWLKQKLLKKLQKTLV